jgi:hypothetical protein
MPISYLSNQELAKDVHTALCAAEKGPVVIIRDGTAPTHVLLSFQDYQELLTRRRNIAASLAMPEVEDVDFDVTRVDIQLRKADFT